MATADLDVVTANWHSNDVTILRNGGGSPAAATSVTCRGYRMSTDGDRRSATAATASSATTTAETITLDGITYAKGIGVHADSQTSWQLNGQCTTFSAVIGVDDEVGPNGSVIFQVYVDGAMRYMSPTHDRVHSRRCSIQVDVSGGNETGLFVHYGWDNYAYDHADWADARVVCTP